MGFSSASDFLSILLEVRLNPPVLVDALRHFDRRYVLLHITAIMISKKLCAANLEEGQSAGEPNC